jgi:hypothetical protein
MLPLTYLLPIRSAEPPDEELTSYLRDIGEACPLLIVDGSEPHIFQAAHTAWSSIGTHIAPDPTLRCANGKVHGVLTGLRHVATEFVVIADDDVRYSSANLADLLDALREADVVVPQNYFQPLPWHARWDTARTLLNRISGGDFPGTLGVRTATLTRAGGYDGDVLFENLELMRTVEAVGGTCRRVPDLYVRRLPPTTRHFVNQRVRQAYDEFARPGRLASWLVVLPALLVIVRRPARLVWFVVASVAAAEAGRRRRGGRRYFPMTCSLFAPTWILERSICVWLSVLTRLRGGVRYGGGRIATSANSRRRLERRDAPALT